VDPFPDDGPDAALARHLHEAGLVDVAALRDCLGEARRRRSGGAAGAAGLAGVLAERRLVTPAQLQLAFRATRAGSGGHPAVEGPPDPGRAARAAAATAVGAEPAARRPAREGALEPGELIDGAYRVERELGRGSMGAVYLALATGLNARVAVKVLAVPDPELRARFEREAELVARADKLGGVVRVHASGAHRALPYYVMDYVEGRDLGALLTEGLPLERAVAVLESVAETLGRCHAAGIVHRDIKPANVLVRAEDGTAHVADFGLARARASQRLTRTDEVLGTPIYMPPEQVIDTSRATAPAVDVYALGAILYQALTGRLPYAGRTAAGVLQQVVKRAPPPPSRVRRDVPPALEAICLRAMARRASDRYADGAELAAALRRYRRGEPVEGAGRTRARLRAVGPVRLALAGAALVALGLAAWGALATGGADAEASARADLAAWARWDGTGCSGCAEHDAHVLAAWSLGLGPGPPPDAAEMASWRATLEAAAEALPAGEVEPALGRLRAHERYLAHLAGEEPPAAATGPGEPGPVAAVVSALVALDRGALPAGRLRGRLRRAAWTPARRLEDALSLAERPRHLPDALAAADPTLATLLARVAPAALTAAYREALEREPIAPAATHTALKDLVAVADRLDVDLTPLSARKATVLKAPAWGDVLEREVAAGTEEDALEHLRAIHTLPPAVEAGPDLVARCEAAIDRFTAEFVAAQEAQRFRAGTRALERALLIQEALSSFLAPGRATVPALADALPDFARTAPGGRTKPRFVLTGLRADFRGDLGNEGWETVGELLAGSGRQPPPADFWSARDRSQAARFCLLGIRVKATRELDDLRDDLHAGRLPLAEARRRTDEAVGLAEGVLDAPVADLGRSYVGETCLVLAMALETGAVAAQRAGDAAAARAAAHRAVRFARRARPQVPVNMRFVESVRVEEAGRELLGEEDPDLEVWGDAWELLAGLPVGEAHPVAATHRDTRAQVAIEYADELLRRGRAAEVAPLLEALLADEGRLRTQREADIRATLAAAARALDDDAAAAKAIAPLVSNPSAYSSRAFAREALRQAPDREAVERRVAWALAEHDGRDEAEEMRELEAAAAARREELR